MNVLFSNRDWLSPARCQFDKLRAMESEGKLIEQKSNLLLLFCLTNPLFELLQLGSSSLTLTSKHATAGQTTGPRINIVSNHRKHVKC